MAKRYTVYLKMHVRDMKKESQQIKKTIIRDTNPCEDWKLGMG